MRTAARRPEPASGSAAESTRAPSELRRHGRYWLPIERAGALQYYRSSLLIPHSRRELLFPRLTGRFVACGARHSESGNVERLLESVAASAVALHPTLGRPVDVIALEGYPHRAHKRWALFLLDAVTATPLSFARLSHAAESVAAEASALDRLQRWLPARLGATLPRLLGRASVHDYAMLLETPLPGASVYREMRSSLRPGALIGPHLAAASGWLADFQRATIQDAVTLDAATIDRWINAPLSAAIGCGRAIGTVRIAVEQSARQASGAEVPLVAAHGDFWAGNVLLDGSHIGVADWEDFHESRTPFDDLFTFVVGYALAFPWRLGVWSDATRAFRDAFLRPTSLAHRIRETLHRHCDAVGVSSQLLELFFAVFLVQRATDEQQRAENGPQTNQSEPRWTSILNEYARAHDRVCFG